MHSDTRGARLWGSVCATIGPVYPPEDMAIPRDEPKHGPGRPETAAADVDRALTEDVDAGDLSATAISRDRQETAAVVAREPGVIAGRPWFDTVFGHLSSAVGITWSVTEGAAVAADTTLCNLAGPARALYTGERTALNFLGLLSGVATATRAYAEAVAGTGAVVLDTRKTIPGLRVAQKYAVAVGGGANHRMGLFDAAMIKENHIHAAGGITNALGAIRAVHGDVEITVEVETLEQLDEALGAGADRLLLDNFTVDDLETAVERNAGRARLEGSGGVDLERVAAMAATGVDAVSVGALTKHVRSLDLSMRFRGT